MPRDAVRVRSYGGSPEAVGDGVGVGVGVGESVGVGVGVGVGDAELLDGDGELLVGEGDSVGLGPTKSCTGRFARAASLNAVQMATG